jgi:hypothetical protein
MRIDFGASSFSLPRDGVVLLEDAEGACVDCLSGALWLTQEGREDDVILHPGESMRVANDGLTLVTALRAGELRIVQPHTAGHELLRRATSLLPQSLSRMLPSM